MLVLGWDFVLNVWEDLEGVLVGNSKVSVLCGKSLFGEWIWRGVSLEVRSLRGGSSG